MEINKESQKKIREKLDSFKIKDTTNAHALETFEKIILKKELTDRNILFPLMLHMLSL